MRIQIKRANPIPEIVVGTIVEVFPNPKNGIPVIKLDTPLGITYIAAIPNNHIWKQFINTMNLPSEFDSDILIGRKVSLIAHTEERAYPERTSIIVVIDKVEGAA